MTGERRSPVRRHEDWAERLERAVAQGASAAFRWGRRDCCLAAAVLVRAMTGVDLGAGWRTYTTADGAAELLATHGGLLGLARTLAAEHGLPEVAPAFAQRGDVVAVATAQGEALGVVDLNGREVLVPARRGWARVPVRQGLAAWRVES